MAKKVTKASIVMEMLNKGMTGADIRKRVNVSSGYISTLKKLLESGVEAEVQPTAPEVTEDMKAALQLITQGEDMKEMAYDITQGRKERRVGSPERKVPGGPVTMVRPTTEDRVERILAKRNTRYGNFIDQARIAQQLKNVAHTFAAQQGKTFDVDQAEAIDMILSKMGRILNGDPNYADSWIDIAGYATLVADRLEGKVQ